MKRGWDPVRCLTALSLVDGVLTTYLLRRAIDHTRSHRYTQAISGAGHWAARTKGGQMSVTSPMDLMELAAWVHDFSDVFWAS
jgi:hypothetical protein